MSGDHSDDEIILFPITDLDNHNEEDNYNESSERSDSDSEKVAPKPKMLMSLRQRRLSKALAAAEKLPTLSVTKKHWFSAIRRARHLEDPWSVFHIEDLPTETVVRHRYNALKKAWTKDTVVIKMENKAFNRGAMRECFRLKKLSNFLHSHDWKHAANYVAKHYLEEVDRNVYFEDVRLQMDAKLWAEEFNRHNPPKKVDIFQMYVLEFTDRPGSPLYHLEHFMSGDYIKYNSNSGFVEETLRHTPQALSHFTFERSGHTLIVVDIQGVGDLYTDPQIHSIDGAEYGDGNLGAKGMALFFHSHVCNSICHSLHLSPFDLAPKETATQKQFIKKQLSFEHTAVRGKEETCISASPIDRFDLTKFLARQRSVSTNSSGGGSPIGSPMTEDDTTEDDLMSPDCIGPRFRLRNRYASESDSMSMTEDPSDKQMWHQEYLDTEEDREAFARASRMKARPSCIANEINLLQLANRKLVIGDSVLGKIHHEMAKYHELGRFSTNTDQEPEVDWEAALFHEEYAAQLGVMEAILTLARLYLGLQRDVLVNGVVQPSDDNVNKGLDYMCQAADAGDRGAMLFMARAFEMGEGLGTNRTKSWEDAVEWYEQAINRTENDESGEFDSTMDDPLYAIQAKLADLLVQGGFGLDKDPQRAGDLYNEAAENAMAAMKGRMATKLYEKAEEAYALVEEEE